LDGNSQAPVTVERIFVAPEPGGALVERTHIRVVAGAGIEGDRYYRAEDEPGQDITLVEAEIVEAFNAAFGTRHELSCTRRNLVTRGVRLSSLVGKEFTVGGVRLRGIELCEPCMGLGEAMATAAVAPAVVVKYLVHRAGIRADVMSSGIIAIGAELSNAE
jgi:MOSC domain-containing protein YiiM